VNSEAIVTVCIFLAAQTGALIFFCGGVSATLRDHNRRIKAVEEKSDSTALDVAQLQGELK